MDSALALFFLSLIILAYMVVISVRAERERKRLVELLAAKDYREYKAENREKSQSAYVSPVVRQNSKMENDSWI